jgi:tetratricopeptide (TPR) repeat protein
MILSALYILFGLFSETLTTYLFFKNNIHTFNILFFLLLLLHAVSVLLFCFGLHKASSRFHFGNPKNWFILSSALCFVFFIIGFIFISIIFVFLARERAEMSRTYEDYERYITYDYEPQEKHIEADKLTEAIDSELEIVPLVDVMLENDVQLRRGAVRSMERLPKKDAVRLLKLSLQDKNVEVRFYAALGLSKIESELNANIIMAKNELSRNPQGSVSHLLLANAYAEYYECGILDEVTADYYRNLAVSEYNKVLEIDGGNVEVLNILANLEARDKKFDSALARFNRVCDIDPFNVYANVGIAQILYETGRISEAIERSRKIEEKIPQTKGIIKEIIGYWSA